MDALWFHGMFYDHQSAVMVTGLCLGTQMYCYGYTGRLKTDYKNCFGGYRVRLHENNQVGLKLKGMITLKVL